MDAGPSGVYGLLGAIFTAKITTGFTCNESGEGGKVQRVCKLSLNDVNTELGVTPFVTKCTERCHGVVFCEFGTALQIVEEDLSKATEEVDPFEVLDAQIVESCFGKPDCVILTTATCRIHGVLSILKHVSDMVIQSGCSAKHAYGIKGCMACPLHRACLLLRLYIICHMDLLESCIYSRDRMRPTDTYLCARIGNSAWPSVYELTYPYGTRCAGKFSASLPPLLNLFDYVHWFNKKAQHKWSLLQCLQKVCPHKYMQRGWDGPLTSACSSSKAMTKIVACLLSCSFFGGYSHCVHFPDMRMALDVWHYLKTDTLETVLSFIKNCPNYVLFSWKEAVVWMMQLKIELIKSIEMKYNWEKFSSDTVRAMNRVREYFSAIEQRIKCGSGVDESLDIQKVDTFLKQFREKIQIPNSKRVLRLPFKHLACKHMDYMLRDMMRAETAKSPDGVTPPFFFEDTSISSKPYVYEMSNTSYVSSADEEVKEDMIGIRRLVPDDADMKQVVEVSEIPNRTKAWLMHVMDMFERHALPDTTAKRWMEIELKNLTTTQFISLHRNLAYACGTNTVAMLTLSVDTDSKHLKIILPDDRPMYVCTCCGRMGATAVVLPKGACSSGKSMHPKTVNRGAADKEFKISRGLKDVAYSFRWGTVFCNKKLKKNSCQRKSIPRPKQTEKRVNAGDKDSDAGEIPESLPAIGSDQKRVEKKKTVPKHEVDRVLLRVCGKMPMKCIDRRGVMMRVGKRIVSTCCDCGLVAELWQKSCMTEGEPVCAMCKQLRVVSREKIHNIEDQRAHCYVCGKIQKSSDLMCVIAFNDVHHSDLPFYRLVKIKMCQRHKTRYVTVSGEVIPCAVQITSLSSAISDSGGVVSDSHAVEHTMDYHTDQNVHYRAQPRNMHCGSRTYCSKASNFRSESGRQSSASSMGNILTYDKRIRNMKKRAAKAKLPKPQCPPKKRQRKTQSDHTIPNPVKPK